MTSPVNIRRRVPLRVHRVFLRSPEACQAQAQLRSHPNLSYIVRAINVVASHKGASSMARSREAFVNPHLNARTANAPWMIKGIVAAHAIMLLPALAPTRIDAASGINESQSADLAPKATGTVRTPARLSPSRSLICVHARSTHIHA